MKGLKRTQHGHVAWKQFLSQRLKAPEIACIPCHKDRMRAVGAEWRKIPGYCSKCRDKGCTLCGRLKTPEGQPKPGRRAKPAPQALAAIMDG